jgi:hypothetical protein
MPERIDPGETGAMRRFSMLTRAASIAKLWTFSSTKTSVSGRGVSLPKKAGPRPCSGCCARLAIELDHTVSADLTIG